MTVLPKVERMSEHWIVKKSTGEDWGTIKKLIIDPTSRQITHADVILSHTGRLIRVPWSSFDIYLHCILLKKPEEELEATFLRASGSGLPETVTVELAVNP